MKRKKYEVIRIFTQTSLWNKEKQVRGIYVKYATDLLKVLKRLL